MAASAPSMPNALQTHATSLTTNASHLVIQLSGTAPTPTDATVRLTVNVKQIIAIQQAILANLLVVKF